MVGVGKAWGWVIKGLGARGEVSPFRPFKVETQFTETIVTPGYIEENGKLFNVALCYILLDKFLKVWYTRLH